MVRKRPRLPPDHSSDDEMQSTSGNSAAWMPEGRIIENVGEGNSTHSSTPDKRRSHRQMRAWTVSAMLRQCPLRYNDRRYDGGQPSNMSWDDYLKDQETPGKWSGARSCRLCSSYAMETLDCHLVSIRRPPMGLLP